MHFVLKADYPEGVVADGVTASAALALPVLQANEDLVGKDGNDLG